MHFSILCHAGTETFLSKCMGNWKSFSSGITLITPENSVPKGYEDFPRTEVGESSYAGAANIARAMAGILGALSSDSDEFCVMEYDCVSLKRFPVVDGKVSGCFMADKDNLAFKSQGFIHSPWVFNRETGCLLFDAIKKIDKTELECGYPDRWFYHLVNSFNIPIHNFLETGEAITKDKNSPLWVSEYIKAKKDNGVFIFHGFKTDQEISEILS